MDQLFLKFDQIKLLSPALKVHIQSILIRKVVKKGEVILREGQVAKYIYFIEEGIVRSVRTIEGKHRTAWIMKEGDIFLSVGSFFSQTPGKERIEALKDCILYCISYEQLEKIYEEFPEFDRHGRVILQYYYPLSEMRNEMRDQPAYDRFVFLMTHQPDLIGEVPDKLLASYLSMAPETFSVQKAKFAKRNKKK
jgi:CRP-like cAMP-binding protein